MADGANKVKFHYIKSPLARDLHIDGVYGGMNPATGQMNVSVFAERPPIPTAITVLVDETANSITETEREGRDGMVRVVQDTLYMNFATAVVIHDWLGQHIKAFEKEHPELRDKL